MTEEQIALARRAVACRRWRWLPGMLAIGTGCCKRCYDDTALPMGWHGPLRVVLVEGQFAYLDAEREYVVTWAAVPDLTDPATLGCLLALVREAHGDSTLFARFRAARIRPDWVVPWDGSDVIATGATEAEALVAALEAVP